MTGQPALSAEAVPLAAARTTARNARDKNDLLDLLAALDLPSDEDTVTALLPLLGEAQPVVTASPAPLLSPRQPHPCPKENHQVNAYRAVVLSMNSDGYSDQQIADELKVSIEEVTQTIDDAKADQSGPLTPAGPTEQTAPAPAEQTAPIPAPEAAPGVDELRGPPPTTTRRSVPTASRRPPSSPRCASAARSTPNWSRSPPRPPSWRSG